LIALGRPSAPYCHCQEYRRVLNCLEGVPGVGDGHWGTLFLAGIEIMLVVRTRRGSG